MTSLLSKKAAWTRAMKAVALKRQCKHCLRLNALSTIFASNDGLLWRTCRYCGAKVQVRE